MMQFLGYVFLGFIVSSIIIAGDYILPGGYLEKFIDNNFIEAFASLVGFNIAAVVFLLGQLIAIEEKFYGREIFNDTRREIKHNSYLLLLLFVFSLVILTFRPDLRTLDPSFFSNKIYYIFNGLIVLSLYLAVIAIFEILKAVFALGKNVNSYIEK